MAKNQAEDDDFWAPSMQPKPDDGVFFTPTPQLKAVSMGVALAGDKWQHDRIQFLGVS